MGKDKEKKRKEVVGDDIPLDSENIDSESPRKVTRLFTQHDPVLNPCFQTKKQKKEKDVPDVPLTVLSPIAKPFAEEKLSKKIHRTIKKGTFNDSRISAASHFAV
jgi:hypothetical protein